MSSRVVTFLLLVMVACIGVYVRAQDNAPANEPQPPSLENLPRLLPPPPYPLPPEDLSSSIPLPQEIPPNVPPDPVEPMPEETPADCGPTQHWGPPGRCVDGAPDWGVTEINGIPYAEAEAIYKRHKKELESIPGVIGAGLSPYGIIVTVEPDHWTIPTQMEGLLVITRPPPELKAMGHTES